MAEYPKSFCIIFGANHCDIKQNMKYSIQQNFDTVLQVYNDSILNKHEK